MGINEEKTAIAEKHRAALQYWIKSLDLTVDGWCRNAGISEGTLRNFLSGERSTTLLAANLELLAKALKMTVGQLLREDSITYKADENLMKSCVDAIQRASEEMKTQLSTGALMAKAVELYNNVIEYRMKGEEIQPNILIARLVLKSN